MACCVTGGVHSFVTVPQWTFYIHAFINVCINFFDKHFYEKFAWPILTVIQNYMNQKCLSHITGKLVFGDLRVYNVKNQFGKYTPQNNLRTRNTEQIVYVHYLSHVRRLWYFSSSINSFFKHACAAIQWGKMSDFWSDPSSTSILHMCKQRRLWWDCADAQARLRLRWSPMW